jgi:hypothetical protein
VPLRTTESPSIWSVADSGPTLDGLKVTLAVQVPPPFTLEAQPDRLKSGASDPVILAFGSASKEVWLCAVNCLGPALSPIAIGPKFPEGGEVNVNRFDTALP